MNKSYTYKGESIIECERVKGEHPGNWIVPARHRPTGLPYSDELCPHFHTLQDARDYINTYKENS